MLLYHTGPQVFQRSLTVTCEMRKRQRERQLMPISHSHTHTNAHCNPGPFPKGSGVALWISSQLSCYSSLHSPMYQTHTKTLFVFMILNPDLIFDIAAVGLGEECANKDLRTNVSHMPVWPPHLRPGHIAAFWENSPGFRGLSGCTNLHYRCVVKQFWRISLVHRLDEQRRLVVRTIMTLRSLINTRRRLAGGQRQWYEWSCLKEPGFFVLLLL